VCLKTTSGKKWLTLSSFEDGGVPVPVCRYDPPDAALYDDIKPLKKEKNLHEFEAKLGRNLISLESPLRTFWRSKLKESILLHSPFKDLWLSKHNNNWRLVKPG